MFLIWSIAAKKKVAAKNGVLDDRERHIEELSDALHQTRDSFSRRMHDLTIRQQQELYIKQVGDALHGCVDTLHKICISFC